MVVTGTSDVHLGTVEQRVPDINLYTVGVDGSSRGNGLIRVVPFGEG